MDYKSVMKSLAAAGLTDERLRATPIGYAPPSEKQGRPVHVLQRENRLRERGWAFVWDDRYWEYQCLGTGVMSHHLEGFWSLGQPPWNEMVLDLDVIDPAATPLLPVVE